ncbi:magnesium transporter [Halorhodospira halochloris]|uniref:magnesium transporter n=1 Tax=Halorhodospira halochloris TaxID=1052 RepID=UPI001EE8C8B0|nr:magnesium transporter [Halorhodospira halochloris]MCG5548517.1 magnesium transporter [Halorhodospira halochloris]
MTNNSMTEIHSVGIASAIDAHGITTHNPVHEVMHDDYLAMTSDKTAADIIEQVRNSSLDAQVTAVVCVIDSDNRYQGFVRLAEALRSDPQVSAKELATGADLYVYNDEDREQAARLLQRRDLPILPVLDEQHHLAGIIRFDDAMDVLEEEASEDVYKKAGVGSLTRAQEIVRSERLTQGSLKYPFGVRLAFLCVALAGGMAVGGVVEHFEGVLEALVALAIFVPVIMDMGGNVGTQSSTIFARGVALGHIRLERFFRYHILRELAVGVMLGAVLGLAGGLIAYFWQGLPNDMPMLGPVIGLSLFAAVVLACVLGFLLPWVLLKLGFDHAPGADPFITTIKDFSALLIYFSLAAWLLGIEA